MDLSKKKRGRKPKSVETVVKDPMVVELEHEKSKKGRKPKSVYSANDASTSKGIQGSLSEDENVIVRLCVVEDECTEEPYSFEDEHPYAYNRDEYTNHSSLLSTVPAVQEHDSLKVVSLLKDFEEKNKVNEWPSDTSICCYWCCHRFNNAPFGIPVNFANGSFNVFGCFCSLECAAAYNFKTSDNVDEMWERYNLINLLSRKCTLANRVKPAPDRLSLKMFGGHMDIDEFRRFFHSNKLVNVNFPPMTSLTQQIEEVNEHEVNNDFKYIPLDQDRIEKYKAKVLFRRTRPQVNNKNSLESTMNLKYTN
jgi:hypothetical protein